MTRRIDSVLIAVVARWFLCACLAVLSVAYAAPPGWDGLPADADAAWGLWEQHHAPLLRARVESATQRSLDADRYFAGDVSLSGAFPHLADARLDDPLVLSARLVALDDAMVAGEAGRISTAPDFGSNDRVAQAIALVAQALTLEAAATTSERRLLLSLRARLTRFPGETYEQTQAHLADIDASLGVARGLLSEDAENIQAARAVAALDTERATAMALFTDLRRLATVPGFEAREPTADFVSLASGGSAAQRRADQRLGLLRVHVSGELAERIDAVRLTWRRDNVLPELQGQLEQKLSAEAPAPTAELEALIAQLAVLEQRMAAPPSVADSSLSTDSTAVQEQIDSVRSELADIDHAQLTSAIGSLEDRLDRASSQAQDARDSSDAALEEALVAASESQAALLRHVAEANNRAARSLDRLSNLEQAVQREHAGREARGVEVRSKIDESIEEARSFMSMSDVGPDDAYAAARTEIRTLRHEAFRLLGLRATAVRETAAMLEAVEEDRRVMAELSRIPMVGQDVAAREMAMSRWRAALKDEVEASEAAKVAVNDAQAATLVALRIIKEGKRSIKGLVSPDQRKIDGQKLSLDLRWEKTLVWPAFLAVVNDQFRAVVEAPLMLFHPAAMWAFLQSGFWLFVFLLGWWFIRARSGPIGIWLISRVAERREGRGGLFTLQPEVRRTVRAVLDLAIGWLLQEPLVGFLPILGFAVWVYLQVALYRLAVALFDLFIEPYGAVRPSVLTLGVKAYKLARHSLRWVAMWLIIRDFVREILQGVLDADGLDTIARWGIDGVGIAGGLYLLHRWAPVLRGEIQGFHQESRWVRFLSKPPRLAVLNAPWAVITGAYLGTAWLWDRTQELAREREGFGRLLAAVTRYRLPTEENHTQAVLPPPATVLTALRDRARHYSEWVDRNEDVALRRVFASWQTDHSSGVTLLTGDPGEGKDAYLRQIIPTLPGNIQALYCSVDRRLDDEDAAVGWLAGVLGGDAPTHSTEAFVQWLELQEPRIVVMSDLQGAFLRTVGGFQGLRALLYLLNAASNRHFVVATCHTKAFQYLKRLGSLVNIEVVREVVSMAPYGEKDMQSLVTAMVEPLGYALRFETLVRNSPFGVDPAIELRRAVGRFYLLLADASDGNPGVALRLLTQCLSQASQPMSLDVRIAPCLGAGTLDALSDDEMFMLVALRMQGGLDEPELVRVTNMSANVVRNVVRNLLNRKLLFKDGSTMVVALDQLPVVTRTLRRRHFLHFVD
jgi:hypothetical protein